MLRIKYICITLDENGQRYIKTKKSLKDFDLIPFQGVDGKKIIVHNTALPHIKILKYEDKYRMYDTTRRIGQRFMGLGEMGCAWSHLLLYENLIMDKDYDAYFIFEDDNIHVAPFKIPTFEFDLIQYAKNVQWNPIVFAEKINEDYSHIRRDYINMASSYLVSKAGAAKILRFSQGQISLPADDLFANAFLYGQLDIVAPTIPVFDNSNDASVIDSIGR
jgi:GR25 family glycosyltransferase involved in LPS biosynthesis